MNRRKKWRSRLYAERKDIYKFDIVSLSVDITCPCTGAPQRPCCHDRHGRIWHFFPTLDMRIASLFGQSHAAKHMTDAP